MSEEFEEFLSNAHLLYENTVPLMGRHGNPVDVDYKVVGKKVSSLVLTLFTENATSAHGLATDAFTKWYDLDLHYKKTNQFVSVYTSTNDAFKDADIRRLEGISTVLAYPADETKLNAILAA